MLFVKSAIDLEIISYKYMIHLDWFMKIELHVS